MNSHTPFFAFFFWLWPISRLCIRRSATLRSPLHPSMHIAPHALTHMPPCWAHLCPLEDSHLNPSSLTLCEICLSASPKHRLSMTGLIAISKAASRPRRPAHVWVDMFATQVYRTPPAIVRGRRRLCGADCCVLLCVLYIAIPPHIL